MKILNAIWFVKAGNKKQIGIIVGEDKTTREKKAYIGIGRRDKENSDAIYISKRGARLPIQILEYLLKELKEKKNE